MGKKYLKIVSLLNPEMCEECRFCHKADVETAEGIIQNMIYCKRLDCDNWEFINVEAQPVVKNIEFLEDE